MSKIDLSKVILSLNFDSVVDKYVVLVDKYNALTDKYLALKGDKTDRELMLCNQVLRMCRGEASQYKKYNDEWITLDGDSKNPFSVCVDCEYRAKPKKELVVPWEFIPDDVASIEIKSNGRILGHSKNESSLTIEFTTALKLDLTGIELPVTVERPTC